MATSIEMTVVTGDLSPTESPHRISDKPTKNTAAIEMQMATTSDEPIRAWSLRFDPVSRIEGLVLARRGIVCGDGSRCGQPGAVPLALPSGSTVEEEVTYTETGPAPDGDYEVAAFAHAQIEGWSP